MAKLTWDATGSRYYESGVDHGVLYTQKSTDAYGQADVWNGLTAVTESPSGAEVTDLWADNIKYASLRAAEQFGGTIEAYTYPDAFAECDGSVSIATGAIIGQQSRKKFGMSYRTKKGNDLNQDAGYLLHLVYGCSCSPSEKAYSTINDSPDAITFSWEFDTTPVPVNVGGVDYNPTSLLTIDSTKTNPAALAALEEILYGTTNDDARMPLPSEVASIIGGSYSYTVAFASNGGSGTMSDQTVTTGKYTLPACTFTPPSNKVFDRWDRGNVGDEITVSADITLTAQWKASE